MVLTRPSAISIAVASTLFALNHAALAENPASPTGSGLVQLNGVWFATAPSENTFILKGLPSASGDFTAYTFCSGLSTHVWRRMK